MTEKKNEEMVFTLKRVSFLKNKLWTVFVQNNWHLFQAVGLIPQKFGVKVGSSDLFTKPLFERAEMNKVIIYLFKLIFRIFTWEKFNLAPNVR